MSRMTALWVCVLLATMFLPAESWAVEHGSKDVAADGDVSAILKKMLQKVAAQDQRIAEQDKKIAEQNRRIAQLEVEKNAALSQQNMRIAEQDQKITDLKTEVTGQTAQTTQREEIKQIVKEAQNEAPPVLPEWLTGLDWFGDLRLRYHYETFSSSSMKDVSKGRFRLRFGAKKTWLEEQVEAGFRIASGSSDDPSSTNQSFDDNFGEKNVWIDRAYVKFTPKAVKGLELIGGKMGNPFVHTNVVWDSDVNPEGVWAVYKCSLSDEIKPFIGAGYFQTDENSSSHNGTLAAYQAGATVSINEDTNVTAAAAWYDYSNYEDTFDRAGGNTVIGGRLAAEEFDVLDVTAKVSGKVFDIPASIWADWAHNTKNTLDDGTEDAYGIGVKLGRNKKKGDLSVQYKYAYIEANASPGAFDDSDFGHSNSRGHQVGVAYNLADFVTAGVNLFYTQAVSGATSDDPRFLALFDVIFSW